MSRRISSLDKVSIGITREIGSDYDNVKIVADNIDAVIQATVAADTVAAAVAAAEAVYDSFDDRYLGVKESAPTLDNDGDVLLEGAMYFDSTENQMRVYSESSWIGVGKPGYTASATAPTTPPPEPGDVWLDTVNEIVYRYLSDGVDESWVSTSPLNSPTPILVGASGILDAISDGQSYVRKDADWVVVPPAPVDSVAGKTGAVTLVKDDVSLSLVDNTSDADKPVSTAQSTALGLKVDKIAGSGLITSTDQLKLDNIADGAQVNVITTDAPSDTTPYARQDAGWVSVLVSPQSLKDSVTDVTYATELLTDSTFTYGDPFVNGEWSKGAGGPTNGYTIYLSKLTSLGQPYRIDLLNNVVVDVYQSTYLGQATATVTDQTTHWEVFITPLILNGGTGEVVSNALPFRVLDPNEVLGGPNDGDVLRWVEANSRFETVPTSDFVSEASAAWEIISQVSTVDTNGALFNLSKKYDAIRILGTGRWSGAALVSLKVFRGATPTQCAFAESRTASTSGTVLTETWVVGANSNELSIVNILSNVTNTWDILLTSKGDDGFVVWDAHSLGTTVRGRSRIDFGTIASEKYVTRVELLWSSSSYDLSTTPQFVTVIGIPSI